MSMDVTILGSLGLPRMCDTEGCGSKATSVWSATVIVGGASGGQRYACDQHSPMANTAMPLPFNFSSRSLCHACGQPVNVGAMIAHG